jgi:hypothetical protein
MFHAINKIPHKQGFCFSDWPLTLTFFKWLTIAQSHARCDGWHPPRCTGFTPWSCSEDLLFIAAWTQGPGRTQAVELSELRELDGPSSFKDHGWVLKHWVYS